MGGVSCQNKAKSCAIQTQRKADDDYLEQARLSMRSPKNPGDAPASQVSPALSERQAEILNYIYRTSNVNAKSSDYEDRSTKVNVRAIVEALNSGDFYNKSLEENYKFFKDRNFYNDKNDLPDEGYDNQNSDINVYSKLFELTDNIKYYLIMNVVEEIADAIKNWDDDKLKLLHSSIKSGFLAQALTLTKTELPSSPPDGKLYAERPNPAENAPSFIQRVYGRWLTGEFTRADLRKIDPKAEMGLRNWERQNGAASLNLPTVKERNDQTLKKIGSLERSEEVRAYDRTRLARAYRERQNS